MNYLRGAVSAISVPYQYYRDLNPSTLTGAIDVIVIRRPKLPEDVTDYEHLPQPPPSETELVCSPFHVRFGKWQVLRPADKKVDVFVNGKLIPFAMKIGEAGEAFFVFETDEDVPDSLTTSPVLAATKPGQSNAQAQPEAGRFGAKSGEEDTSQSQRTSSQEPEFLDLNASAQRQAPPSEQANESSESKEVGESRSKPTILTRAAEAGKALVAVSHELEKSGTDKLEDQSVKDAVKDREKEQKSNLRDRLTAVRNISQTRLGFQPDKGDEALASIPHDEPEPPTVRYTDEMVFDLEGYHSHSKERSDRTMMSIDGSRSSFSRPRSDSMSSSGSQRTQRDFTPSRSPSPSPEASPSGSYQGRLHFPPIRATSEPPPEIDHMTLTLPSRSPLAPSVLRAHQTHSQPEHPKTGSSTLTIPIASAETDEYSWEWGHFPQKTPMRTTFAQSSGKGKERIIDDDGDYWTSAASKSSSTPAVHPPLDQEEFGAGGMLTVDRRDPTKYRVFIEGKAVEFEVSILPSSGPADSERSEYVFGYDEIEDARRFDAGKIDFLRFLEDGNILNDDGLVIRWADKYITRRDGSPLMHALAVWRERALRSKTSQLASSRPVSPSPSPRRARSVDSVDERMPEEKVQFPTDPKKERPTTTKPSSSSWVRWWSRSRREDDSARPELRPVSSAPTDVPQVHKQPDDLLMPVSQPLTSESSPALAPSPLSMSPADNPVSSRDSEAGVAESNIPMKPRKRFAKTLRLTSDQLKSLDLKAGPNTVTFSLSSTGVAACTAKLFVWDHTDQIVVSDIDGTITKSDALGHVFTMIGRDWTHVGVAKLYTDICRNGYKIMYLTSRAIGQADSTRDYLKNIRQNDYQLPEGPVIMSPDRLMASLHREVIMRKPEVFKMACLRDIQRLFGPYAKTPFYAGFGNRITDALSYRSVNIPSSRIFTIDSSGEVKMELLELAGYKSSYIHMTDLVDQMFPPINRKWASEYTDFNYWKTPLPDIPLPDLNPPSPALSARSDTSNQSALARLRNFSLVGNRQSNNMSKFSLPPPAASTGTLQATQEGPRKNVHLRQMSSLERLSSTIASLTSSAAGSPRSISPTFVDSDSEDEEGNDLEKGKRGRRRSRTRSITSMPGSLPGSTGSDEDEEAHSEGEDDGDGSEGDEEGYKREEQAAEDAFDEYFLATGEMQNVPFL
ncbi:LNS2-domain-containing protein [Panus rudis PR-1116 ss-1]|nr:LNS2-domain-containing protein [Panus rudis PR-1116 ss-1]